MIIESCAKKLPLKASVFELARFTFMSSAFPLLWYEALSTGRSVRSLRGPLCKDWDLCQICYLKTNNTILVWSLSQ